MPQLNDTVLRLNSVSKVFESTEVPVQALHDINVEVAKGDFVAITGPSGSGKSTLLHLIGGLDRPTSGTIVLDGVDLTRLDADSVAVLRRRKIGFIHQFFNLLDFLNAEDNVALPLWLEGVDRVEASRRAWSMLNLVGLGERRTHYPPQLSGGEQQRVAIARAVVTQPAIILADEPVGNLDIETGDQIIELLRAAMRDQTHATLLVTHDRRHTRVATRTLVLRDGRIRESE
ncbi:MAG TPA: ABC transporter ATP-binding protein [Pirellulales bacterium]|jgi:putative ABC transport system ATP-binding protein|nr:ABC transporter ATP-binding protein [Pirellulales bacterium]